MRQSGADDPMACNTADSDGASSVANSAGRSTTSAPCARASVAIAASGRELRQVNGREEVIPFLRSKIENAEMDMANNVADDNFSDGSAANQIGGLQLLVEDASTSTVGGISRTAQTWWANHVTTAASAVVSRVGAWLREFF